MLTVIKTKASCPCCGWKVERIVEGTTVVKCLECRSPIQVR